VIKINNALNKRTCHLPFAYFKRRGQKNFLQTLSVKVLKQSDINNQINKNS